MGDGPKATIPAPTRRSWVGRLLLAAGLALVASCAAWIAAAEGQRPPRFEEVVLTGEVVSAPSNVHPYDARCEIHVEAAGSEVGSVFATCGGFEVVDASRTFTRAAHVNASIEATSKLPIDGHAVDLAWSGPLARGGYGSIVIDTREGFATIIALQNGVAPERWRIELGREARKMRSVGYD